MLMLSPSRRSAMATYWRSRRTGRWPSRIALPGVGLLVGSLCLVSTSSSGRRAGRSLLGTALRGVGLFVGLLCPVSTPSPGRHAGACRSFLDPLRHKTIR
jgi:hypothetical protein